MNCPDCRFQLELSWQRYLRSWSGRHVCPRCAATFRFRLTARYLLLWLDVLVAALITGGIVRYLLVERLARSPGDPWVLSLIVLVPVMIWGSAFLVLNRRALDRLETKRVRVAGSGCE